MSWPTWNAATAPPVQGVIAPSIQSSIIPTAVNPAPIVGVAAHPSPVIGVAAQPASGGVQYSQEQWAQMQQQNWQQWAQWQQQYQQWHQQYGAEYQKSLNALTGVTPAPNTAVPPPPPNESKPPPPPPPDETRQAYSAAPPARVSTGYSTVPPPTQQYASETTQFSNNDWPVGGAKRSLPQNSESNKRQMVDGRGQWTNKPTTPRSNNWQPAGATPSAMKPTQTQKVMNLEELTEAEKKFDKEFAAWEAQFNKWKDQNANHPDKTQYLEYEKKWESWRNSLLDRREQMRKKRTALQASMATNSTPKPVAAPTPAVPPVQPPQHNFSQPPPQLPNQGFQGQASQRPIADNLFSKPPPTQNNEPLSFKQPPPDVSTTSTSSQNEVPETGGSFLKSSSPTPGGIPGLDLVKDGTGQDDGDEFPPDATDPREATGSGEHQIGPDFDAISKGINNILGDSKLMNILSMVSQNQNIASGASIDMLPRNINFSQPPPAANPAIPSLLNMTVPRPSYDRSNQSFEEYPEPYNKPSQVVETVNNFDDQTRMSFTNGPTDQDVNFSANIPPPGRTDFNSFQRGNNRQMFGQPKQNGSNFVRKDSFEGQFRNNNGPSFTRNNSNPSQFGNASYSQQQFTNPQRGVNNPQQNFDRYEEDNEEEWNEEEEYDKYHDMFNDGEQSGENQEEAPLENSQPPADDGPLFVPEVVVDYEHKSLKEPEPEVELEMLRMFDYRHKPVNRIPYPQRPSWLSSSLRNIQQFDPLASGRFGGPDLHPVYERDPPRYPPEKNDQYLRRGNYSSTSNDDKYGYSNKRDRDFGRGGDRERTKNDYNSSNNRTGFRRENFNPRNRNTADNSFKSKLELEELSDDDWEDDNDHEPNEKRRLKFSPPKEIREEVSFSLSNVASHSALSAANQNMTLEDLINPPGRFNRPSKIVIILRGPPGSGKTYLAKLIKDREVENGGSAPRILSLDDYFMVEQEREVVEDGKVIKVKDMKYEYEAEMEESYRQSLIKSFKKTITDGYFHFVVVDNINQKVRNFGEMWSFAKQNGFQVYICQLDLDPELCTRRNVHHRTESYIEDCIAGWEPTPSHHPMVDATTFMQSSGPIREVEMEEVEPTYEQEDHDKGEEQVRSKWDSFDCSLNNLARLDGVSKPLRPSRTMEEYLQMDNEWQEPNQPIKPGQKRVRWADLEEQRQQKKMKALGFVVGHTDWNRMMDPTNGESALRQTKFIESRYQ